MKNFNKKSMGWEWHALYIVFFVSIIMVLFSILSLSIPKVGVISTNIIEDVESGSIIPQIINIVMEEINKGTTITYENHPIFGLDSYCNNGTGLDDSGYKERLIEGGREFDPVNTITKRDPIKCYADEEELMKYYEEAFSIEYEEFRSTELVNPDLSSTDYIPEVVNEGTKEEPNYFIKLITANGFTLPITIDARREEKNIGSFTIKPNFKLKVPNPANKPFNSTEICIFARICGATCHDVLEINSGSNFKLKEDVPGFGCDAYHLCTTPLDQFDEEFSCNKENEGEPNNPILCRGQCIPFCSISSDRVEDEDVSTQCNEFSCSSYLNCNSVGSCGCPDPSAPQLSAECQIPEVDGNCETLHCERDGEFETKEGITTQCLDSCGKYGDCGSTSLCSCSNPEVSCQGSCYCNPEEWESTGGCGDARDDGISCDWSEIPQRQEYDPSTCSGTDYRCLSQPKSVCPCVPDVVCADLSCGQTDTCGNYCGDCVPEPEPIPPNSCEGSCGGQAPAGCWCDSWCDDPLNDDPDCCGDKSQWC